MLEPWWSHDYTSLGCSKVLKGRSCQSAAILATLYLNEWGEKHNFTWCPPSPCFYLKFVCTRTTSVKTVLNVNCALTSMQEHDWLMWFLVRLLWSRWLAYVRRVDIRVIWISYDIICSYYGYCWLWLAFRHGWRGQSIPVCNCNTAQIPMSMPGQATGPDISIKMNWWQHFGGLNAEVNEPWNLSKVHNVHNDTVQWWRNVFKRWNLTLN